MLNLFMQNKGLRGPSFSKKFKINCLHFVVVNVLRGHLPHGVHHLMVEDVATCLKTQALVCLPWCDGKIDGKE